MPTQATLTAVPLPMNPAVEQLFGKLEALLGPKACLKGSSETYFRYATKGDDVLLLSLKLNYDNGWSGSPGKLRLIMRLASIGDPLTFSGAFGFRYTKDGFNRLNFAEYTIARGSTSECLDHVHASEVIPKFAQWLDAKVFAAGATPQEKLVETLAAVYLTGIRPVTPVVVEQPVVDFDKGFSPYGAPKATPPVKSVKNTEVIEDEEEAFEDSDDSEAEDDE